MRSIYRGLLDPGASSPATASSPRGSGPLGQAVVGNEPVHGVTGRPPGLAESDPAARLPEAAGAKLQRLRAQQEDINAVLLSLSERLYGANEVRQRTKADLETAEADEFYRPKAPDVVERAERARVAHAAATAEHAALAERVNRLQERRSDLPRAIDDWLRALPRDTEIAVHNAKVRPDLKVGETPAAAVARYRDRLAELQADLHQIASSPVPSSVVKQRMSAQLAALAERGRPGVLASIETGRAITFPSMPIGLGQSPVPTFIPDTLAVLIWAFKDQIEAAITAEIDSLADDGAALTDTERTKKEAAIFAEILAVGRIEEVLISQGEEAGLEILRRPDADPRAILNLSSALPGRRLP